MAADPNWFPAEVLTFVDPSSLQIALAATGQGVHLVWSQASTLFHARRVDGTWQAPLKIAAGEQPSLAASVDGKLVCAFANWFLGNREIYVATWNGAVWSLPQLASRTTGESSDPAACVGADGRIHLAWADNTPGYSTIYYAVRESVGWKNAPVPNGKGSRPSIAVSGREVLMAWQARLTSSDSGSYDVLAASRCDEKWTLPDIVSDTPTSHSVLPHIAINSDGHCHLVWQEERDGLFVVRQSDRWPNGWTAPVDVSSPSADARLALTAPNSLGLFQFVWSEGTQIKHRVRPGAPQGAWWSPEVACDTCAGVSELVAAISSTSGELHAVFSRYVNGTKRRFYYTQRKAVGPKKVLLPLISR